MIYSTSSIQLLGVDDPDLIEWHFKAKLVFIICQSGRCSIDLIQYKLLNNKISLWKPLPPSIIQIELGYPQHRLHSHLKNTDKQSFIGQHLSIYLKNAFISLYS